jgi:hypothetical protein
MWPLVPLDAPVATLVSTQRGGAAAESRHKFEQRLPLKISMWLVPCCGIETGCSRAGIAGWERSGESDTHFVDGVARSDAVLSPERRKPIGARWQARLVKADENEVRTLRGNLLF